MAHGSPLSEPWDSQGPYPKGLLQTRSVLEWQEEKSLEGKLRIIYFNLLGLNRGKPKIHRVLISEGHIARVRGPEAS